VVGHLNGWAWQGKDDELVFAIPAYYLPNRGALSRELVPWLGGCSDMTVSYAEDEAATYVSISQGMKAPSWDDRPAPAPLPQTNS
jgi:hypothetical protein